MNVSLILGRLSLVAAALTAGASWLAYIRPTWAVWALGLAAGISAFTERVQGGKSKVDTSGN